MLLSFPRFFWPLSSDSFRRFSGSPAMLPETSATNTAAIGVLPFFFSFHSFCAEERSVPSTGASSETYSFRPLNPLSAADF
ncbi:hypothetical protein D3C80_1917780 [compost metagenome]